MSSRKQINKEYKLAVILATDIAHYTTFTQQYKCIAIVHSYSAYESGFNKMKLR